jgi:hypothetical protein
MNEGYEAVLAEMRAEAKPPEADVERWKEIVLRSIDRNGKMKALPLGESRWRQLKKHSDADIDLLHREILLGYGLSEFDWELPEGILVLEFDPKAKIARGEWTGMDERLRVRMIIVPKANP